MNNFKNYKNVLARLEKDGIEYHITPCDEFNQVVVYPNELKNSTKKTFLVLLNRDDDTGELTWFPYEDEYESYLKPYLYLKHLDVKNWEDSFDLTNAL